MMLQTVDKIKNLTMGEKKIILAFFDNSDIHKFDLF